MMRIDQIEMIDILKSARFFEKGNKMIIEQNEYKDILFNAN